MEIKSKKVMGHPPQAFQWEGLGANSYEILVGNSVGSSDIGRGSTAAGATEKLIHNLPTNGNTVYVRLISKYTAGNVYRDYQYTAVTQ